MPGWARRACEADGIIWLSVWPSAKKTSHPWIPRTSLDIRPSRGTHFSWPLSARGRRFSDKKDAFSRALGSTAHCQCAFVGPVGGVGKAGDEHAIGTSVHGPSNVVEVQVGQEHVGDVLTCKACRVQASIQGMVAMQVVMAEELLRLFVPNATIHQARGDCRLPPAENAWPMCTNFGHQADWSSPKVVGAPPQTSPRHPI